MSLSPRGQGSRGPQHFSGAPARASGHSGTLAYWAIFTLATAARVCLANWQPLYINTLASFDDALLMSHAQTIAQGDWVLATIPWMTHISYQAMFALLIVVGAWLFSYALKPLVPSRWIRLCTYGAILYMPCLFSGEYFQRVYRLGITAPFVMAIVAGLVGMYLRRRDGLRSLLPWSLVLSVSLAAFWYLKEDSAWVLPLLGVVYVLLAVAWVRGALAEREEPALRRVGGLAVRLVMIVLPLACVACVGAAIRNANLQAYGVSTTNEKASGAFAHVNHDIIAIDTGETNRAVWTSRKAFELAMDASPTLATLRPGLERQIDTWVATMSKEDPDLDELRRDYGCWALLLAAGEQGTPFTSGAEENEFWTKVAEELERGFADGGLPKRTGCVWLSSIARPIYLEDVPHWLGQTFSVARELTSESLTATYRESCPGDAAQQRAVADFLRAHAMIVDEDPQLGRAESIDLRVTSAIASYAGVVNTVLLVGSLISLVVLLVARAVRKNAGVHCGDVVLIWGGMLAAGFEILLANEWFMDSVPRDWLAGYMYGYCSSYYVLLFCGALTAIAAALQVVCGGTLTSVAATGKHCSA